MGGWFSRRREPGKVETLTQAVANLESSHGPPDVTIVVKGGLEYDCHQVVLTRYCAYFR